MSLVGSGSGGSGAIRVPSDQVFSNIAARDAFFVLNPSRLAEGAQCVVLDSAPEGLYQVYSGNEWQDRSAIVEGRRGDKGDNGDKGDKGDAGAKVIGAAFAGDDIQFTLDDSSQVTIPDGRLSIKGDDGTGLTPQQEADLAANTAARHQHANKSILDATTGTFTLARQEKLDGVQDTFKGTFTNAAAIAIAWPAPQDGWAVWNTETATVWSATDGVWADTLATSVGDMLKATYDPQGIAADAFHRANHMGTQAIATVDGLQASLEEKAPLSHVHNISDVTGLQQALDALQINSEKDDLLAKIKSLSTLHLDFLDAEYLTYNTDTNQKVRVGLLDAVNTSRDSLATSNSPFGLKTYGINTPRVEYNQVTREPLGLLCEEQRTNLIRSSGDVSNTAFWVKGAGVTTVLSNPAPLSSENFYLVTGANSTSFAGSANNLRQSVSLTAGATYTLSCTIEAVTATEVGLYSSHGAITPANFSVVAGQIARLQLTFAAVNEGLATLMVGGANGTFKITAAQLEVGSFPTSYIPTGSTVVTRFGDHSKLNSQTLALFESTHFVEFRLKNELYGVKRCVLSLFNTTTNFIRAVMDPDTSLLTLESRVNESVTDVMPVGNVKAGLNRLAITTNADGRFSASLNGSDVTSVQRFPFDLKQSEFRVGQNNLNWELNGTIQKVVILPVSIPDADIKKITSM